MSDLGLLFDNPGTTAVPLVGLAIVAVFVTNAAKWPAWVAGIIIAASALVPLIGWADASTAVMKGQWMLLAIVTVAVGALAIAGGVWLERRRGDR